MQTSLKTLIFALFLQTMLTGCASMQNDVSQSVRIETYSKELKGIAGARCIAKSERGEWTVTTPGSINAHRSAGDLQVSCSLDGQETGMGKLISRANVAMYGNLLLGGVVGAITDHQKGTAYSYPDWIRIVFGDDLIFDRSNSKENAMMSGLPVTGNVMKKVQVSTDKVGTLSNP